MPLMFIFTRLGLLTIYRIVTDCFHIDVTNDLTLMICRLRGRSFRI